MALLRSAQFNILFFNGMWLLCVIGRDEWLWLSGPLLASYCALLLVSGALSVWQLVPPILIGLSVDSVFVATGLFVFDSALTLPIWLILLWVNFSVSLNLSLRWLGNFFWPCVLLGSVVFPLNYAVGEQLGAVTFGAPYALILCLLAAVWAPGLPLLMRSRLPLHAADSTHSS